MTGITTGIVDQVRGKIRLPINSIRSGSGAAIFAGNTTPTSGTTSGTGYNFADKGSVYIDGANAQLYINAGTGGAAQTWKKILRNGGTTTVTEPLTTSTFIPLYVTPASGTVVMAWGSGAPLASVGSAAHPNGYANGSIYLDYSQGAGLGKLYVCIGTSPINHNWIVVGSQS